MKRLIPLLALLFIGCGDTIAPYTPMADLTGNLTACDMTNGRYFTPVTPEQSAQVSEVYVRWSGGSLTHIDGSVEVIWCYWQAAPHEVGKEYVTVKTEYVYNAASHKEYLIRF